MPNVHPKIHNEQETMLDTIIQDFSVSITGALQSPSTFRRFFLASAPPAKFIPFRASTKSQGRSIRLNWILWLSHRDFANRTKMSYSGRRFGGAFNDCIKILKALKTSKQASPFLEPVNPLALGIPDYFHVIKRPMDLGTVEVR
jgi:hypothetical protein